MKTTTLDRKVVLQRWKTGQGHTRANTLEASAEVYASVRVPGMRFRSTLAASGLDVALTVTLWRREFEQDYYTHIVIGGETYRIASVGAGLNELFVSVAVERGSRA